MTSDYVQEYGPTDSMAGLFVMEFHGGLDSIFKTPKSQSQLPKPQPGLALSYIPLGLASNTFASSTTRCPDPAPSQLSINLTVSLPSDNFHQLHQSRRQNTLITLATIAIIDPLEYQSGTCTLGLLTPPLPTIGLTTTTANHHPHPHNKDLHEPIICRSTINRMDMDTLLPRMRIPGRLHITAVAAAEHPDYRKTPTNNSAAYERTRRLLR